MRRWIGSVLVANVLLTANFTFAQTSRFDGKWEVSFDLLPSQPSNCIDLREHYFVIVELGQLRLESLVQIMTGANVYATVSPSGLVSGTVERGQEQAAGEGTLGDSSGKGRWVYKNCQGTWNAWRK